MSGRGMLVPLIEPVWRPIDGAPRDGERIWGKVGDDAVAMLWHPKFQAWVSSWRQMALPNGHKFETGSSFLEHSPTVHHPDAWMPMPKNASGGAGDE